MVRHTGIILKRTNPTKSLYSVLDKADGVIFCSIARQGICPGAYIEYTLQQKATWTIADNVELVSFPVVNNTEDLLLLHRVLEICIVCMPIGCFTPGIFEYISALYDTSSIVYMEKRLVKNIFLCKLLALLGFYPHEKKFQNPFFHSLINQSLDKLVSFSVSMVQEKDIEEWLQSCIAVHIQEQKLKMKSIGEWMEIV
jgi:hypothetical protein